jgi:hypothetical protein
MKKVKIYKLIDPITREIRYVGETSEKELIGRIISHIAGLKRKKVFTSKTDWLIDLLSKGYCPLIELIEEVDESVYREREKYWIQYYSSLGANLFNIVHNEHNEDNSKLTQLRKDNKSIKIYQYDFEGHYIGEWNSIIEAANYYDLDSGNISVSAKGSKRMTGNFQWKYYRTDKIDSYIRPKFQKKVYKYDLEGNFLEEFEAVNIVLVGKTKLISKCCNGKLKTVYGFRYSFEKHDKLPEIKRKLRKDKGIKKIDKEENKEEKLPF